MTRLILVIHRYVGVVLGVLMTLWCLSGFVMMYQTFPDATGKERLAGLEPIGPAGCCIVPGAGLADDAKVSDFRIETLGGAPVLRLRPAEGRPMLFDLTTGRPIEALTEAQILEVADAFARGAGVIGRARDLGVIDKDQWVVATAKTNRPVHLVRFDDAARTDVYVNGRTGEVFQHTNARERFWSWLGAVPHWLYPTLLRQHPKAWGQVVIWTSTVGAFLTVTGLWIGIVRLRRLPNGRLSPFRGVWFWHHMTGLFFGLLTLTWVFSGLLTMNPWGLLLGDEGTARETVAGQASFADVRRAITAVPRLASGGVVRIAGTPLGGTTALAAFGAEGQAARFDLHGAAKPLSGEEVRAALGAVKLASLELLTREDAYYYGHPDPVDLPVWRAILDDGEETRLYLDARTGRIVREVGADGRSARWLQSALHDFDWPVIRQRPVWDLVTLPLLAGVTIVCALGAWLGLKRIGRDVNLLRTILRRRRKARAATS